VRRLLLTAFALVVLWAASFGLSYVDLGRASLAVALGIAALKAVLVVLVFMELLHEKTSVKLAAASALLTITIFVTLVAADVATRAPAPFDPPEPRPDHVSPGTGAPSW
jgi:cytochrome c oxidase subunit 4